jgi:endonuclease/exonuclease/phosphatase family metal-dependent hydrolase
MHLRVMTYNIHRAIGVDRRFRPERVVEVLSHHNPDVALLQEVDEGAPRSRELDLTRELAIALDYPYFAVGHNVSLRKGRYGNATLSRHPIHRERNIDLTIETRKRRGCQHTTLGIQRPHGDTRVLDVFNLHLGLSAWERARQVGLLARSKEFSSMDPHGRCILGGDFNDWRSLLHPIFTEILGFHCATQRRLYKGALNTYPAFSPTGGLDKLYFRGGIRLLRARACRLRISRVASDHLPVIADFEVH